MRTKVLLTEVPNSKKSLQIKLFFKRNYLLDCIFRACLRKLITQENVSDSELSCDIAHKRTIFIKCFPFLSLYLVTQRQVCGTSCIIQLFRLMLELKKLSGTSRTGVNALGNVLKVGIRAGMKTGCLKK